MPIPNHQCPQCGAPLRKYSPCSEDDEWFIPYKDYLETDLKPVEGLFGYVQFDCECTLADGMISPGSMRVVRYGNAIAPVIFTQQPEGACTAGQINAQRVREARNQLVVSLTENTEIAVEINLDE